MSHTHQIRTSSQDEVGTRLGRVHGIGFVDNELALVRRPRRVAPSYILVLVRSGVGSYVDDAIPERPIGPGDTILVVPGHPHWYGPPPKGRWSEIYVVFDGPVFDALAVGGVLDASDPLRRVTPLETWCKRLQDFADRPHPASPVERKLEVLDMASLLVELRDDTSEETTEPAPWVIRHASELLARDLSAELDLHDVAAECGLSYQTFRKHFRATTGTAPAAFRLNHRIEVAQILLRTTAMTHAAIAESLGFADERHFAKLFRSRTGMSPRNYRRATPSAGTAQP